VRPLLNKLTYANVMATIAVFIALGGGAYAATQLKKNTVGAKQLKKNAVTGVKVKDQSLTGKDIKLSSLGTVPAASHANSADTASALSPPEASHIIGASGEPGFENGSGNTTLAGVNYGLARFYKDKEGVVHLAGAVTVGKEGSSFLVKMFTLPPGFRPANGIFEIFPPGKELGVVVTGANASFEGVFENGAVLAPKEESVSLSGITYRAEG
jgi:hypothetical protein